jgi:hypothetical protein
MSVRKERSMPEISVTLVDRTQNTSSGHENFKAQIMREVENILLDLITPQPLSESDIPVVNIRWVSQSPAAGDQDLVIHWVEDKASSYLQQKWSTVSINPDAGGHTYITPDGKTAGSEFYRHPRLKMPAAYAKLAAHEGMHNITRMGNKQLHGQGGLAGDTGGHPQLPVTDNDRKLVQAGMQRGLPDQLL